MKWSLNELNKKKRIEFDERLDLNATLTQRSPEILDISDVQVVGEISYDDGLYVLTYRAFYELTLPSSRSLKPVIVPMELAVAEVFAPQEYAAGQDQDDLDASMILYLDKDLIDLDESVADNILLEIPLQVFAEDETDDAELPSGSNWKVMSEADYEAEKAKAESEDTSKNPFSQLSGLFDNE
jgi:uncharacterized protein